MSTDLPPECRQYLADLVKRGAYADECEALAQAVALLRRREELRAEVQVGIDEANRGHVLPAAAVFERLEPRAKEIEDAAGHP